VIDEGTGRRASAAYTEPDLVIVQLNQPLPPSAGRLHMRLT
jgi:hypothetical protein